MTVLSSRHSSLDQNPSGTRPVTLTESCYDCHNIATIRLWGQTLTSDVCSDSHRQDRKSWSCFPHTELQMFLVQILLDGSPKTGRPSTGVKVSVLERLGPWSRSSVPEVPPTGQTGRGHLSHGHAAMNVHLKVQPGCTDFQAWFHG